MSTTTKRVPNWLVVVPCPKCGSRKLEDVKEESIDKRSFKGYRRCRDCGHKF
jgi:transcription elongation factor Elf1